MAKQQQRITLADVAQKAGVSQMTVSRVINNTGRISSTTRSHVQAVADSLGYRPSSIARSLVTNKSYLIGLVVPDITNPFFATITRGVQSIAWQHNYNVLLTDTEETPDQEKRILNKLDTTMIDGLIVASSRQTTSALEQSLEQFTHVVLINQFVPLSRQDITTINSDFDSRARNAISHLAKTGHKNIAYLNLNHREEEAREIFFSAAESLGLDIPAAWCKSVAPTWEGGYYGAHVLLESYPELESLIGGNDMIAMGIMKAVKERGLRIPEDIAIVGGDDTIVGSQLTPALTSFRIDTYGLGTMSAECLFRYIEGDTNPEAIVFPDKMIVRESAPY